MNKWIFIGFSLWTSVFYAQQNDSLLSDTLMLQEIVLSDDKLDKWAVGASMLTLDSALTTCQSQDLATLLSSSSHIRIRNYGALASSSIRGAGASHTQVLWNGLRLNNPMTGQFDLSLVPVFFIENIQVQSGGLGVLLGDGAIGGSIHLNNENEFSEENRTRFYTSVGSFGRRNLGVKQTISVSGIRWALALYRSVSENDFPFSHPLYYGAEKKQVHAKQNLKVFQNSISKQFGDNFYASIIYFYQEAERLIPPTFFEAQSTAEQKDKSHRWVLKTNYQQNKVAWNATAAFTSDRLIFIDSLKNIHSNHNTEQFQLNNSLEWELNSKNALRFENTIQHQRIYSKQINANRNNETRSGINLNYRSTIVNSGIIILGLREEVLEQELSPLLPSASFRYTLNDFGVFECSANTSFRRPTWNDRYWTPGGNPDLKVEQGKMLNLSFEKRFEPGIVQKKLKLTTYYGRISDWIIWLPQGAYWSPMNLANVEQKGLELEFQLSYENDFSAMKYQNFSSFQSSTNTEERVSGDAAEGKQLMYVPLWQVNQGLSIMTKKWEFYLQHHFESKRFTTDDHSNSLAAYHTADIGVQKDVAYKRLKLNARLKISNLLNHQYQLVQGRPMPGRALELNFNLYL